MLRSFSERSFWQSFIDGCAARIQTIFISTLWLCFAAHFIIRRIFNQKHWNWWFSFRSEGKFSPKLDTLNMLISFTKWSHNHKKSIHLVAIEIKMQHKWKHNFDSPFSFSVSFSPPSSSFFSLSQNVASRINRITFDSLHEPMKTNTLDPKTYRWKLRKKETAKKSQQQPIE